MIPVRLDVRASNLRCTGGAVRGLLDWSNALVGYRRAGQQAWLRASGGRWPDTARAAALHLDVAIINES